MPCLTKYLSILFAALTISVNGQAQSLPDSLQTKVREMSVDSSKVSYLNDLSRTYWRSNIALAQKLADDALKLSRNINFQKGECRSLNYLGIVFTNKGVFDSAMLYLNQAHELAVAIDHEQYQYFILNSKGIVQRKLGNYEQAIEHYLETLAFAERIGTKSQVASIIMNIGNIHYNLDNFNKAASFYERSLELYDILEQTPAVDHLLNNLGDVYGKLNDPEKALSYFKRSLSNKEKTGNKRGTGTTYVNIAMLYQSLDSMELVGDYFEKAIVNFEETGTEADAVYAYYGLADLNVERGNLLLARNQAFKALQIANERGMREQQKEAHQLLAEIFEKTGQFKTALGHFKSYNSLKDTLFNEQTTRTINELEIQYETAKKEKEIVEANAEIDRKERFQKFLYAIIGTIIVFSSIGILLLVQRFKLRKALLFQEIDTLRVQINSIFGGGIKSLDLTLDQINEGLFKPLSEREYEILSHAISEQTNNEIADAVFISVNTVKSHLKNIYMKLGVSNRKEALEVLLAKS